MHLFRKTIKRECSECEKELTIKLRRPRFGLHFWKWKIISGGYYWGRPFEELPDHPNWDAEYWECYKCYYDIGKLDPNVFEEALEEVKQLREYLDQIEVP